jgi:hypothetical protein
VSTIRPRVRLAIGLRRETGPRPPGALPFRVLRGFPIDGAERTFSAEGRMRRLMLAMLAALSLGGCYVHEYVGPDRRPYRHERWHGEDVYRREDGRWYVRRGNGWVVRPDVEKREEREERRERRD